MILQSAGVVGSVPRRLSFQYNPEELSRSFEVTGESSDEDEGDTSAIQPEPPIESFSLTLLFDATEAMESPDQNLPDVDVDEDVPASGTVAVHLAALEQLLYPADSTMVDSDFLEVPQAPDLLGDGLGIDVPLPRSRVPVVLFVWGRHSVLPVRMTSFSVDEKQFSPELYPIRAEVSCELEVLRPKAFGDNPSAIEKIAMAAYSYTMSQREALSLGAFGSGVQSVIERITG